jgi:hypothetical protein
MPKPCRCGQRLIWATTEAGNRMPINAEPDPDGNVALWQDVHQAWQVRVVTPSQPRRPGEVLHRPHHSTCPFADEHRKPKPRRAARTYAGRAAAVGQGDLFA